MIVYRFVAIALLLSPHVVFGWHISRVPRRRHSLATNAQHQQPYSADEFQQTCDKYGVDAHTTACCIRHLFEKKDVVSSFPINDQCTSTEGEAVTPVRTGLTNTNTAIQGSTPTFAPTVTVSTEEVLSQEDFIRFLLGELVTEDLWESLEVQAAFRRGPTLFNSVYPDRSTFINAVLDQEGVLGNIWITSGQQDYFFVLNEDSNMRNIKVQFNGMIFGDKDIANFFKGPDFQGSFIPGLVKTTKGKDYDILSIPNDPNKYSVLVIAGESGSGKSAMAKRGLSNAIHPTLYISCDGNSFLNSDGFTFGEQLQWVRDSLKSCIMHVEESGMGDDVQKRWTGKLYVALSKTALDRNARARADLQNMIENKLEKDTAVWNWWKKEDPKKLDSLVIIVDEAGKNLGFAEGIIDDCREFMIEELNKRAKKSAVVLCGTGLEVLTNDRRGSKITGTDPAKSDVVVMTKPQLDFLDKNLTEAIQTSSYAKMLASNTRFLMDGLLFVLYSDILTFKVYDDRDLLDRRKKACADHYLMDFAARKYPSLNAATDMLPKDFDALMQKSFLYLWRESIKDRGDAGKFFAVAASKDEDTTELFRCGYVTRDISQTSAALRYLASTGGIATTPVDENKGGEKFEQVVNVHFKRLFSALGFSTASFRFSKEWPKPFAHDKDFAKFIDFVQNIQNQPDYKNDARSISHLLKTNDVVVIRQSEVEPAPGPDIFIVQKIAGTLFVDFVQCKGRGNTLEELKVALESMGVHIRTIVEGVITDMTVHETAVVSGDGKYASLIGDTIKQFCTMLEIDSGLPVQVRNRIVATNRYSTSEDMQHVMIAIETLQSQEFVVWTKEFLEPTISSFDVKDYDAGADADATAV